MDGERISGPADRPGAVADRLERLQRIAGALSSLLSPSQVAEVILREVGPQLGGVSHALWLIDAGRTGLELVLPDEQPGAIAFARMELDGGLPGAVVVRTAEPLFVSSREERDRSFPDLASRPGDASFAVLPLAGAGGPQGVLAVAYDDDHEFHPEERRFLAAVADLAAQALERARLEAERAEAEEELRYRAALLDAQIRSAPQAVLAVSPERIVLACNRRYEELWRLPPGTVQIGGPSPALLDAAVEQVVDQEAFEKALRWGHDHPNDPQKLDVPLRDGRVIEGVSSPIIDDDGVYRGRIWFLSDDTERRAIEAQRTELLDRLQAAQRSQAFLLEASRVLARVSGYAETLEQLAAVAVPTLGDLCLIDVTDETGEIQRMAARHADPSRQVLVDELELHYPPAPGGHHPSIEVMRTGQSRWSATMTDEFLRSTCRDEHHYELTKALGFSSYMTVPLVVDGIPQGAVTLVSAGSGRSFGPEDLALAEDLAAQVAAVVAKARRYDDEHRMAHALQSSLLPASLPDFDGVRIAVRYLASTRWAEVGGDWFDALALPNGRVGLAVGDVAGHDVGAAAAMGQLRSAGRSLVRHAEGPASLLALLHASWDQLGIDRMATCVVVHLDPVTGRLEVACAGHPPPLLLSAQGATFLPVRPGAPLGAPVGGLAGAGGTGWDPAAPGMARQWHGTLQRGDVLLLYTDGLVEDRTTDLDRGMARLAEAASRGPLDPEAICDRTLAALTSDRSDDVALLAVVRP